MTEQVPYWCFNQKKWLRFSFSPTLAVESANQSAEFPAFAENWQVEAEQGPWTVALDEEGTLGSVIIKDGVLYKTEWKTEGLSGKLIVFEYNEDGDFKPLRYNAPESQPFWGYTQESPVSTQVQPFINWQIKVFYFSTQEREQAGGSLSPVYRDNLAIHTSKFLANVLLKPWQKEPTASQLLNLDKLLAQVKNNIQTPISLGTVQTSFTTLVDFLIEDFDKVSKNQFTAFYEDDEYESGLNPAQKEQIKKEFIFNLISVASSKLEVMINHKTELDESLQAGQGIGVNNKMT